MGRSRGPYVISGLYLLFGTAWILLSDRFVAAMASTPEAVTTFQTYKGSLFIAVTTVLLFVALQIYARRKANAIGRLQEAEDATRGSLRDKEALIKELHHRVKNNLQVINSMLRLDAMHGEDELRRAGADAVGMLREFLARVSDRIYAMALVHENIYRCDATAEVDVGWYIRELSNHIAALQGGQDVKLEVDVPHAALHMDQAIPCGIALNEALSNAYKHAFGQRVTAECRVRVAFRQRAGTFVLTVLDTGRGFDPEASEGSLGMSLIHSMARQLEGEAEISSNLSGSTVEVRFPVRSEARVV
ncbi:MAG: hypothetical protein GVY29_06050 [Spirochaetes bacterium]|jgi:two-component sensor histidine kinase|nr:hypothetical protein [Spirochaetota bacterium]